MRTSAATTPPSESFTTSPGTSSAAGTVFHAPSRRTEAVQREPRLQRGKGGLGAAFLKQAECGVEYQQAGDNRSLDIFAERQLKHDRGFEHPGNRRPEFFERHAQGCTLVSGIAFAPYFLSRRPASSLDSPDGRLTSAAVADVGCDVLPLNGEVVICLAFPHWGHTSCGCPTSPAKPGLQLVLRVKNFGATRFGKNRRSTLPLFREGDSRPGGLATTDSETT